MKNIIYFLYPCMIFCHIVDDFYLQGILTQMKQKEWQKKNYPEGKYFIDYLAALIIHGVSWSFMIHLPILAFMLYYKIYFPHFYIWAFIIQAIIHAIIDDLKVNRKKIGLFLDQYYHLLQIMVSIMIFATLVSCNII